MDAQAGVFYIGLGDRFNGDEVKAYPLAASSFCPAIRPRK
jgi:hypothetical protein